jgi:hypothetical protein
MSPADSASFAVATEKIAEGLRLLREAGLPTSTERIYREFVRPALLGRAQAETYATNDLVTLQGSFHAGQKELRVNGAAFDLDLREFLFLYVLGRRLLKLAAEEDAAASSFLTIKEILDDIKAVRVEQRIPEDRWRYPVPEDIRRVVNSLRNKITAAKGNENLIESGQRGGGYRLSTAAWNLDLRVDTAAADPGILIVTPLAP